jgi:PhnB protein
MVEPYLNLQGKSNEAIEFYEKVFNGQGKAIMRFKDAPPNPDFPVADELKDLVLHAEMIINGTKFHFSDTQQNVVPGNMISFAVTFTAAEEVKDVFNQLAAGGEILMELAPTFFSPMYGWVKDKFGVGWQLICQ